MGAPESDMESSDCGPTDRKASTIWITVLGSRGDHEPAAALALGLKERGHRVKVFGSVQMRKLFEAHGVDFDGLDMDVLAHPSNLAAREKLGALAVDAGFEGPNKEEDYLFDTLLQWAEFVSRSQSELLAEGKPFAEAMMQTKGALDSYAKFKLLGKGLDTLSEIRGEHAKLLAKVHGQALEDYTPIAHKRRSAFRASMDAIAAEMSCTAYEVLNALLTGSLGYCGNGLKNGDDQAHFFTEFVNEMYSWYDILAKDEGASLAEYWERWLPRLPPLEACMPNLGEIIPRALQNMQQWFDAAAPMERPDLIISHFVVFSAAVKLQAQKDIEILYWSPLVSCRTLDDLGRQCTFQIAMEGEHEGVPKPLRKRGPLRLLRLMQSAPLLVSGSALAMKGCSPFVENLRAGCTGKWVLDGSARAAQQHSGDAFGTPQDDEALEAFLAADGGAPICIGWGSMPHANGGPRGLAELVVKLLRKIGRRCVIIAGWSGLRQGVLRDVIAREYEGDPQGAECMGGRILLLASVSHESLFPRCACAVHHGGSGTTHAALRAGIPMIVAPLSFDQPDNADWVVSLGCGVRVAKMTELTADELAGALTTVLGDEGYQRKAREAAAAVVEERGVDAAVDIVEKCLLKPPPRYTAPAEKPPTWANGLYEFSKGSKLDLSSCLVEGEKVSSPEQILVGQMWAGDFHVGENNDGVEAGKYTVQAFWAATVLYGRVSEDGRELTWHDGSRHTWKAENAEEEEQEHFKWEQTSDGIWKKVPALLEDGTYSSWKGVKLPLPPTVVRDGNFFMGPMQTGSMEAGDFNLEEEAGGRRPGRYTIKASWPAFGIERFGRVTEGGKKLALDDGSSLQWESPLPGA